jgi:hypothetical protein
LNHELREHAGWRRDYLRTTGLFLGYQAGVAVVVDLLWVAVFASYLLAVRRMPTGDLKVGSTIGV